MAKQLTKRQRVFVAHYLKHNNATRAAIAAGYSKKGAPVRGVELLTNRKVSTEIEQKTAKALGKLEISAESVLQEIARLAFLDPRKFFDANGCLIPIHELDDNTARCLAGMEIEELFAGRGASRQQIGVVKKIKFVDKASTWNGWERTSSSSQTNTNCPTGGEFMKESLPYYRWYWKDYRADRKVQQMNYVTRGLYRELLDECWAEGFIPNDPDKLAEICGCPKQVLAEC